MSPTASQFIELASRQKGDRYVLGSAASLKDPDPDEFDCSGLVAWSLGRLGINFPRPAQTQYNNAKHIEPGQAKAIAGALLFKYTDKLSAARPRHIFHVGISLGNGKVVEAKGRKYGVVITNFTSSWNRAGLVPGLEYGKSAPASIAKLALLAAAVLLIRRFYY
jgi:cell wall-associated NlpC family hydrolase